MPGPNEKTCDSADVTHSMAKKGGRVAANFSTAGQTKDSQTGPQLPTELQQQEPVKGDAAGAKSKNITVSREVSPVRSDQKTVSSAARPSNSRSRTNSVEFSPTPSSNTSNFTTSVPSAAAIQRALSVHKPQLQSASVDGIVEVLRSDRSSKTGDNIPQWPISPRLKSPPPSMNVNRSSLSSLKTRESEASANGTSVKRLGGAAAPDLNSHPDRLEGENENAAQVSGLRTPIRAPATAATILETVNESSVPTTPSVGPRRVPYPDSSISEKLVVENKDNDLKRVQGHNATESMESGSESGGTKSNKSKPEPPNGTNISLPHARPVSTLEKRSLTNLGHSRGKPAEAAPRTMTVETETVRSVPQGTLNIGGDRGVSGRLDNIGSIRTKPSTETIRPKKEKRKPSRKPTSLNTGSKADIFEAKVASAIDETNSSDSEETFVYESNPPEPVSSRQVRNHSRTPSATSLASQLDGYGPRYKAGVKDGTPSVAGKRSMKFTNNNYNNLDGELGNAGSAKGVGRNATPRHHHIGRYGRGGHASLFDTNSPFTQANKAFSTRIASTHAKISSRPSSPRISSGRLPTSPSKGESYGSEVDEDGADDERLPLVGSVRINRYRHNRRPNSGTVRPYEYIKQPQRGCLSRYWTCILSTLLLLVLCSGAGIVVMALSRPLTDVSIRHIQNVLASEQEIMLDLDVRATNQNLFAVVVNDLDVNVFAKSGYVGTASTWREHHPEPNATPVWRSRRKRPFRSGGPDTASERFVYRKGVDEGNDPIGDPEGDPQTMLLGRILELDSPLVFEASPIRRQSTRSVGEVRLATPGNRTEQGGSARWERVLQHPFELIVRGVIQYQLPLSSQLRSASVGSRIKVYPKDDGVEDGMTLG